MANVASSSSRGGNPSIPHDFDAMRHSKITIDALTSVQMESPIAYLNLDKTKKKEQEYKEEYERLRIENDEEFQLWLRKVEVVGARRHRRRIQRRGAWKPSWGKTRSMTESDSENEEKQDYYEKDMEKSSDDSQKKRKRARKLEKEKKKMQEYEYAVYERYLAEKTHIPRRFARTMSEPLNVDSDGEEILGMYIDGNLVFSGPTVPCSDGEDNDEDEDHQGIIKLQMVMTVKAPYYVFDELNYTSDSEDDSE